MSARSRLLGVAVLALLAIAAACDGDDADPTPTATGDTGPTATAPAEAQPTVDLGAGAFVYLLDGDLWVASLDGSTKRQLTSGAIAAHVAGVARTDDGMELYYVEQVEERIEETTSERAHAEAVLYRVALAGGEPEELLRFDGRPTSSYASSSAALSPDGAHVLYADAGGISLLDVAAGASARLLENSPPCEGPQNCFGYLHPRWSPDGEQALLSKVFWEGGADILIDPFAETIEETRTAGGSAIDARWSPDGASICLSEFTYANAGAVLVYDVATGEFVDATAQLDLPPPPLPDALVIDTRGCAWAPDGTLAIAYHAPDDFRTSTIAIVGPAFEVLAESEPVADLIDLAGWLPDGSGVVFNRWQAQEGVPLAPGIYEPAAGLRDLPFQADAIVAIMR